MHRDSVAMLFVLLTGWLVAFLALQALINEIQSSREAYVQLANDMAINYKLHEQCLAQLEGRAHVD